MSEFKREARYIVIKTSDLEKVPTAYRSDLVDPLSRLQAHLPNRDFVVVESDWPEYEPVWRMIEARMNGEPNALDAALAREAALREELALIIKSFDELAASVGFSEARLDQTGDSPIDCANQLQQRLTDAEKRAAVMEKALTRIAKEHDCGCVPCTGSCVSQTALEITVEAMRDIAAAALKPVEGEWS